jgi:hypothetical protein
MIAPLLLFSFIENSFSYVDNKNMERNWINLEFQVDPSELTMKLIHGKTSEPSVRSVNENGIVKARKHLDFFYPGNYELKTTVEPEMMMTYLRIVLDDSVDDNAPLLDSEENGIYSPQRMTYAIV